MKNHSIGRYISTIYRYQSIIINNRLEKYGFGCGQYQFFIHIANNPGINQKQLSHIVKINRANTHRAIKKLEALGYIYTQRDSIDKRIIKSYLSENGENLLPDFRKVLKEVSENLIEGFSDDEKRTIYKLLKKVEINAQNCVKSIKEGNI